MSYLLTEPTAVLVVGGAEAVVEDVRRVVTAGDASGVVAVQSRDGARELVRSREDLGCVLVAGADDVDPLAVWDDVRASDDLLPVVVRVPESAVDPAALTRRRDCRYLPPSVSTRTRRSATSAGRRLTARR